MIRRVAIVAALALAAAACPARAQQNDIEACRSKDNDVAIGACSRIIDRGSESPQTRAEAFYNRGGAYKRRLDAALALRDFAAAEEIDPKKKDYLEAAFYAALAAGDVDGAATRAQKLIEINRTHSNAHLILGVRALSQRQYREARTQFAEAGGNPVQDLTASLLSGWSSFGANDGKGAVDTIDKLKGPDWFGIFKDFHSGLIDDLLGARKDAGTRLERAHKKDSSALRVAQAYGSWVARNGKMADAEKIFRDFDKTLPNHPLVVDALAQINRGVRLPQIVDSAQAGAAEVLYGIGAALGRREAELSLANRGLAYLQLAIYLDPSNDLAVLSLADLYEAMKKPDLAIATYARLRPGSALKRNADIQAAIDLDAAGDTNLARINLEGLIAAHPRDLEAIMALGNIERERKLYDRCAATYSRGVAAVPTATRANWTLFYFRGICYERGKRWPEAEADLRKALELYPDQPNVLNYLGYSSMEQGGNLDEALRMINRSLEQRPDDGYIVDSFGWANLKKGDFEEAERQLSRAVKLKPDDASIRHHYGVLLLRLGKRTEAIEQLTEARKFKPDSDELARIEDSLRAAAQPAAAPQVATRVEVVPPKAAQSRPIGRRVALVIGNSAYKNVAVLPNPARDAGALAAALRAVGFETVTLERDLGREKLVDALRQFARVADGAEWAAVFYAGHGIEVGGVNYLLPTDVRLDSDRDVQFEAVPMDQLMVAVEGARKLRLIVLDACRQNPFESHMRRTVATRAVGRGLARVEPDNGTLIAFAAKHGEIAMDGEGENSPFVTALLRHMATPGVEVNKLFRLVRDDVLAQTNRKQEPFVYGSLPSEDFFFVPPR